MRPAILLLPFALCGLTAPAASANRPSQVCRSIAAMLHAGLGDNAGQAKRQTLLETLAHNSRGRLLLANWQQRGSRREAYLRAIDPQAATAEAMTAALRADRLVAVMAVEGSASCMYVTLLRPIGHRLVQIVPPYVTRDMSCQRWGDTIFLGTLDGRPFVAKETSNATEIQVAPWNGHGWDPVCSDVVRYIPKLMSVGAFCRAADCTGAEIEARRVATLMKSSETQDPPYQEGVSPQLDRLMKLAGNTLRTDVIPTSSDWQYSYSTDQNLAPYLAMVGGRPTLAIAGVWKGGHSADSETIGYAVAFWQEAGDKLKPVAGFHLRRVHSKIKSVLVTR
jgi:hypothetical protein